MPWLYRAVVRFSNLGVLIVIDCLFLKPQIPGNTLIMTASQLEINKDVDMYKTNKNNLSEKN